MLSALARNKWAYLFLLPWFLFFTVFTLYPFLYGIAVSFTDFDAIEMDFTGLANYRDLLTDELFGKAVVHTLQFASILIPSTVILALLIARFLQGQRPGFQTFTKAAFYLPTVVCEAALVIVWKWLFHPAFGLSTMICNWMGVQPVDWFGNTRISIPFIAVLILGYGVAQPIILYSAAMGNIPASYYEAAAMDGARQGTVFFGITLPLLRPTTTFILITSSIGALQIFATPYLLTGGGPNHATTTILLLLYKSAFLFGKYGFAAAIGVVLFIAIAAISVIQFRAMRSGEIQY